MEYAELLCVSNFSFQHGASHPRELVERAHELGYRALALTDECSLAAIVRAHEAAQVVGIPLIIGSQFRLDDGNRIALLAPTQAAYTQLCELITRARRRAEKGRYRISPADFNESINQTIALWVPGEQISAAAANWFASVPARARYVTFTHTLAQDSVRRLMELQELSARHRMPLMAVGDVHYHVRARRALHDVLTALRLKTTVAELGARNFANSERHLRPRSMLRKLYPADLLKRTIEVAEQCIFSLKSLHYEYPEELVPQGRTALEHLRALTSVGMRRRWPEGAPPEVVTQIEKELKLISELRFAHYFLTVEDLVSYARSRGILCQGRGSAANSAVCYALGVTEVDPARMNLLLERFISKERHEPPDIDIDFEHRVAKR